MPYTKVKDTLLVYNEIPRRISQINTTRALLAISYDNIDFDDFEDFTVGQTGKAFDKVGKVQIDAQVVEVTPDEVRLELNWSSAQFKEN